MIQEKARVNVCAVFKMWNDFNDLMMMKMMVMMNRYSWLGKSYYHSEKLPEGLKSASAETPVSTVVYPYGSSLFCKPKFIKCSAHMVQLKWYKYVFSDIFFMWHPNIMRSNFVRKFTN